LIEFNPLPNCALSKPEIEAFVVLNEASALLIVVCLSWSAWLACVWAVSLFLATFSLSLFKDASAAAKASASRWANIEGGRSLGSLVLAVLILRASIISPNPTKFKEISY